MMQLSADYQCPHKKKSLDQQVRSRSLVSGHLWSLIYVLPEFARAIRVIIPASNIIVRKLIPG